MRPEEVLCSRRQFLARCGMGLGALGLASLLSEDAIAAATGASPARNRPISPSGVAGLPGAPVRG